MGECVSGKKCVMPNRCDNRINYNKLTEQKKIRNFTYPHRCCHQPSGVTNQLPHKTAQLHDGDTICASAYMYTNDIDRKITVSVTAAIYSTQLNNTNHCKRK